MHPDYARLLKRVRNLLPRREWSQVLAQRSIVFRDGQGDIVLGDNVVYEYDRRASRDDEPLRHESNWSAVIRAGLQSA